MSNETSTTTVHLFNKHYAIKCPAEEVADLQQSLQYLEKKMLEVSNRLNQNNIEFLAVNAALNICHELILAKRQHEQYIKTMNKRIQNLQQKIETSLTEQKEIEL